MTGKRLTSYTFEERHVTPNADLADILRMAEGGVTGYRAGQHLRDVLAEHRPQVRNGPFIECSCGWTYDEGDGHEWVAHVLGVVNSTRCGALSDWMPMPSPSLSCELETGHTGPHMAGLP